MSRVMSSVRVHAVTINTANINGLLDFYQAIGLEFQMRKIKMGSEIFRADAGGVDLTLFGIRDKEASGTPPIQLSFNVENIAAVFTRVSNVPGCNVILDPVSLPDGIRAVVLDPDGHSVEFFQKLDI